MFFLFFFNDTATTEIYTLSLHDALPISTILDYMEIPVEVASGAGVARDQLDGFPKLPIGYVLDNTMFFGRSEEHTSELQSHSFISYAVFCLKKKTTSE